MEHQRLERKRIDHVAVALHDLGEAKALQQLFDLPVAEVIPSAEYEAKLAMLEIGDTQLELLEGSDATPLVGEWLRTRGEGLFHICLEVDDIRGALAELKQRGVGLLDEEPRESRGHLIAFIDPASTANILIELAQIRP